MTANRPRVVVVAACAALAFVLAAVAVFSPPSNSSSIPGCPGFTSSPAPATELTPADPVLLPRCDGYSIASGPIAFSIRAPVNLLGAWASTSPLEFAIFNTTVAAEPNFGWPCPCAVSSGSFNDTLFPGNYVIEFSTDGSPDMGGPLPTWVATEPIMAVFDLGLDLLSGPQNLTLPADGYAAWPISAPNGSSGFTLEVTMATTACDYELAMLPPAAFQTLQSGKGIPSGNGTELIIADYTNACQASSTPSLFGPFVFGPSNWQSGDEVVFANQAGVAVTLDLLGPLEVSYLTA